MPEKKTEIHISNSEEETLLLARELSRRFRGDELVLLTGPLGAGKTIFAKGVASGLGLEDIDQVNSPSYTLVNIYQGRCQIFHIDLYRLENESEIDELGWEDFLDQGVIIVEWGEKLHYDNKGILVQLDITGENQRKITISKQSGI
jgi:tRNA threonylcarbamoyladenosine biosynthesis protein TsaE